MKSVPRFRELTIAALLTLSSCGLAAPQATNPTYLAEMPPVERVLQAMQASDPDETAARQMGACWQLKTMIEDISGPRQFQKGGLTPDETRLRQAYYTAYYQISQSKPQYKPYTAMRGYDVDPKFRNELIQKLFPPTFAAEYPKLMAQAKGQNQALHSQAEQIRAQQAAKEQAEGQKALQKMQPNSQAGQYQGPKTPEQKALNRCVTSGRPPANCTGASLLGGFTQMISQIAPALGKQRPPGPTMSGVFQGSGGWRIDFNTDGLLVNCSMLSPNQKSYKVEFKDGRTLVVIDNTPKPLVLTLTADGNLVGPGPVVIDGVVPSGYVSGISNATQQDSSGNKYDAAGNRAIETPGYTRFVPQRTTCSSQNLSSKGAGIGIETMETNLLKMAVGADSSPPIPPGLRMSGLYGAQTGFNVEFFPESVIVACGDPARAYPYHVVANGSQTAIKVEDPGHPLLLNFRSDGSLDPGAGSYLVHGRRILSTKDDGDFNFAPLEATCNLGVLVPGATPGAAPGAAPAATTTASAAPAAASGNAQLGAAVAANPSVASGNAVLTVASGFPPQPGVPNPLAGHTYTLLKQSYESLLTAGGVQPTAGMSLVKGFLTSCMNHQPVCQQGITAANASTVSGAKADATGKAQLPGVPPGTYYFFCLGGIDKQLHKWDFKIEMKTGANNITLSQSNATAVN